MFKLFVFLKLMYFQGSSFLGLLDKMEDMVGGVYVLEQTGEQDGVPVIRLQQQHSAFNISLQQQSS